MQTVVYISQGVRMRYSVFVFCFSALLSLLLTPLSMRAAHLVGAIDVPDGGRHRHTLPTPRLGGLALYFAAVLTALLSPIDALTGAWLAGGGILAALGVSDDIYTLSPRVKLSVLAAVALLPAAFGLAPTFLTLGSLHRALPSPLGILFTLAWVLLLSNAYNLIDGMDALAPSLGLLGAVALFLLRGERGALILAGALLGFLPYNRPALSPFARGVFPTRSFLGDTGALFFGYSLATLSLGEGEFSLCAPLIFAFPLLDLGRVFLRRLRLGGNPFHADRSHFHHLLADRGLLRGEILLFAYLCTAFFTVLAFLLEGIL